jgi:hypothetical protein
MNTNQLAKLSINRNNKNKETKTSDKEEVVADKIDKIKDKLMIIINKKNNSIFIKLSCALYMIRVSAKREANVLMLMEKNN